MCTIDYDTHFNIKPIVLASSQIKVKRLAKEPAK